MSRFFEATRQRDGHRPGLEPTQHESRADSLRALHTPAAAPVTSIVRAVPAVAPRQAQRTDYRTVTMGSRPDIPCLPFADPSRTQPAESYRMLRTRIVQHAKKPRIICVSSSNPGDGKTVTACNLATSLALKNDTTALLIDGDLRHPQLSPLLGVPGRPGLAEVLAGTCTINDAIVRTAEVPRLCFLPAGRCSANPTELLDSLLWHETIDWCRENFSFTIVDSPPVGIVADYDLIQSGCEGLILVARPGHTNRALLKKTIEQMPNDRFLGVVLNAVQDWLFWRRHDHYYDGYYKICTHPE